MDLAVEADEDVEEELTLDGDDEDADFPEKREGLLDDADDYHTPDTPWDAYSGRLGPSRPA